MIIDTFQDKNIVCNIHYKLFMECFMRREDIINRIKNDPEKKKILKEGFFTISIEFKPESNIDCCDFDLMRSPVIVDGLYDFSYKPFNNEFKDLNNNTITSLERIQEIKNLIQPYIQYVDDLEEKHQLLVLKKYCNDVLPENHLPTMQ